MRQNAGLMTIPQPKGHSGIEFRPLLLILLKEVKNR
jgi:hypothetical protein